MTQRWEKVLDIGLTFWVLRGPVLAVGVGAIILLLVPQAQDLLVEPVTSDYVPLLLLGLGVLFAWAIPTHYAARLLLTTDARYGQRMGTGQYGSESIRFRRWVVTWSPRLLGMSIFAILLGAALRARLNVPDLGLKDESISRDVRERLVWLAMAFAVLMAVFLVYAVRRGKLAAWPPIAVLEACAHAVWTKVPASLRMPVSLNPANSAAASALGPFLLLILFGLLAVLPIIEPYEFARRFPRAAAVPFVLGGWIPVIALLCGLGRRYRAPFITSALVLVVLLPTVFHSSYRVRLVNADDQASAVMHAKTTVDTSGLTLNDAVSWWRANNRCDSQGCPRPIIVAASGGASRAGFFTASVIGQMLDGGLADSRSGNPNLVGEALRNRLFAFSTVSGSSVGAVMATAAMAASPDGKQPCTGTTQLWYGAAGSIKTWRDCLEALMAGDFLTPIFTGLVFHDVLRFIGWRDRGVLLEQSLEDQFKNLIDRSPPSRPGAPCTDDLRCPFMALRPSPSHWLPILVLNSTSVQTGQRIITTALDRRFQPKAVKWCPLEPRLGTGPDCPLFQNGKTFRELLEPIADAHAPNDVRLSTAAHNSARFPLLSPPGEISNAKGELADRIVDGGYFENLGVQTATEIAEGITAVDADLKPFVLVITNDPTLRYERKEQARIGVSHNDATQSRPSATSSLMMNLLTDVAAPLSAVSNTRDARGILALEDIGATLYQHNAGCNFAHIRVWGEPSREDPESARDLSWSWWLSRPVQQYLHQQTDAAERPRFDVENGPPIDDLLRALVDRTKSEGATAQCAAYGPASALRVR
jgi:predicted acylesterase/phospholipase RssA